MTPLEQQWLNRLLDLSRPEQDQQLQQIAHSEPALRDRLLMLLEAAANSSHVLVQPVLGALEAVTQSAMARHQAGQSVAGYRLLRELGRGGMSVVWLAERLDGVIKRTIALKLPLYVLTSTADKERFAREKDVLAALTHPNIARLYDAGVCDSGQPFIVLEYIDGVPITTYCDQRRLSVRERLQLFLQALAAVEDAHRHLIVHLDLKPSNILVDAQGRIKLLDFGIAKLLNDPATTRTNDVDQAALRGTAHGTGMAMTALYAAPEQVAGKLLSTQTDVYALGVLLHELLTGSSPYSEDSNAPSIPDALKCIAEGTFRQPSRAPLHPSAVLARGLNSTRRLQSLLRGDLDAIVHKAMSREPAKRYGSAERFALDLRRFLADRTIDARAAGVWHTVWLFLRRHRAAGLTAGVGAVLSLAAAWLAFQQYQESLVNQQRAVEMLDFMFNLADDAEPKESQTKSEVTAQQMIDSAVARARTDFAGQPRLQGELLGELGRIYGNLGQQQLARQVTDEALRILQATQPSDDPILNRVRAHLAGLQLYDGEIASARELATQARDNCTRSNSACARARAPANGALSEIYARNGQTEAALQAMQQLVKDTELGLPGNDAELAEALGQLAVTQRNAGHLVEASRSIERALALSSTLTLRKIIRIELLRTAAVADYDLGRYNRARERLQALLREDQNPAEAALQHRLLANVQLAEGNPTQALAHAQSAITLAVQPEDGRTLFAHQARAQALAQLGRVDEALEELQRVETGLLAIEYSAESPEVLRARRIRGEILLRAGRPREAQVELQATLRLLRITRGSSSLEMANVLDLLGCAERELGQPGAAMKLHVTARAELEKSLPANHPTLVRNKLYELAASGNRDRFGELAAALELPRGSIWPVLLEARLDPAACSSMCTLILW